MKKFTIGILTLALVLSIGTTSVFAGSHHGRGNGCGNGSSAGTTSCQFVDEDEDGICDTCDATHKRAKNGTGKRGGCGKNSRRSNYTDSDNDGTCDNYKDGNCVRS